ncbi:MFS transporter [Vulcanisaeta thermophila]|uniref:MFS transporter n=1 Tax=Vulcanisaeta thermophila TaxID=867917 RepID=UPI000852C05F|nr:MFS transporter [Vulcanisaeta thermophila]
MDFKNKLALIGGVRSLGGSLLWSFTGFALYQYYRLPLTVISLFYVAQAVVGLVSFMVGGYLADFLGRITTMVLSSLASSLSLLIAFIINKPIYVVAMILIQTFFNNAYGVSNTALIGDYTSDFGSLVKYFSRFRVGVNAGWAVGPAIGGLIYELYGFRVLLLLGSLIPLASVPLLITLTEPHHSYSTGLTFRVNKQFTLFLIPTFLTFIVMGQLGFSLLTFYNVHVGLTTFQVGVLYMINGLMVVFMQDLIGRYLKTPLLISLGMVIYGVSYLAVAFIPNFEWAALDMVLITMAEMIVSPLSQSLANMLADPKNRGKYMGLYGMVSGLGRTLASSVSSMLMTSALKQPLYLWGFIFITALVSALIYGLILRGASSTVKVTK